MDWISNNVNTLLESIIIYLNSELSSSDSPFERRRGGSK